MPSEVFLDASYAVALSSVRDLHHTRAVRLAEQLTQTGTRIITTRAVVLEIGNALARLRHREAAIRDCVSFTVMLDRGLGDALTADEHFRQAGLRALLLE